MAQEPPAGEEVPEPVESGDGGSARVRSNWKRALAIGLLCFAVWLVLYAPTLMKNAEGSVLGTRRTVAMDVLRPIAWLSRATGLAHVDNAINRALGRGGSSVVQQSSGPAPGGIAPTPPTIPPTTIVTTPNGHAFAKPVLLADGWPPFPPISTAHPLRVLIVGDSVGTDLGEYGLVNDLGATNVVSATLDGHISTGLTRPDYFNWPAELSSDLGRYHPQLTIVCIGANDAQNAIVDGNVLTFGTNAWYDMYAQRVSSFITEATSHASRVLWVGMPPMASSQLNNQMKAINTIFENQVAKHAGAEYLSSDPSLGGPGGSYTSFKDGVEIRTDDGIHLQPAGAELLSAAVIRFMDSTYHLKLNP